MHDDAFGFGFFNLFQRRRHLFALFQADEMHFLRARRRADSDTSTISLVATALTFSADGSRSSTPPTCCPDHLASRGPRHIHSHVAAADQMTLLRW